MRRAENEPDLDEIKREAYPDLRAVQRERGDLFLPAHQGIRVLGILITRERKRGYRKNLATRRVK